MRPVIFCRVAANQEVPDKTCPSLCSAAMTSLSGLGPVGLFWPPFLQLYHETMCKNTIRPAVPLIGDVVRMARRYCRVRGFLYQCGQSLSSPIILELEATQGIC